MKALICLVLVIVVRIHANAQETILRTLEPEIWFYHIQLRKVCQEIRYNFVEEIRQVSELYRQLAPLTDPMQIHALVGRIRQHSDRIIYMSRPEWSSEKWSLELFWYFPRTLFFEEAEYLELKRRMQTDFRSLTPEQIRYVNSFRRGEVLSVQLLHARFLNSENKDVGSYFKINTDLNADAGLQLAYTKKATALEMCQFVRSVEFEIVVRYRRYGFNVVPAEIEKKFTLLFLKGPLNENSNETPVISDAHSELYSKRLPEEKNRRGYKRNSSAAESAGDRSGRRLRARL